MENRYYCHNRRKFNLKVYVVLITKYRRRLFQNGVETTLKGCCQSIADIYGWKIIAMETDVDHIHILLEFDTTETVSSIVHKLKQRTTHALWECYPQKMRQCFWKRKKLWTDGFFACSIGEASASVIQEYINSQG